MTGINPGSGPGSSKLEAYRLSPWSSFVKCVFFAGFCLLVHYLLEDLGFHIPAEVFLHISIAFMVAGTLIVLIESKARNIAARETREFREQVSMDVFTSLFGRIVPKEVVNEIEGFLRYNIVRRDCKYLITFMKPHKDMPEDSFVIRRQVTYWVQNLLNEPLIFEVRSSHSEDIDVDSEVWKGRKFHLGLRVGEEDIPLEDGVNVKVEPPFVRIIQNVHLKPRERKEISFYGEEPAIISSSRISYLQATPVTGIDVTVVNQYSERVELSEVQMNHPGGDQMKSNGLGWFALERAFLPGQGFQVAWKEVVKENEGSPTT